VSKTIIMAEEFGIYWSKDDLKNLRELLYIGLGGNIGDERINYIGIAVIDRIEERLK